MSKKKNGRHISGDPRKREQMKKEKKMIENSYPFKMNWLFQFLSSKIPEGVENTSWYKVFNSMIENKEITTSSYYLGLCHCWNIFKYCLSSYCRTPDKYFKDYPTELLDKTLEIFNKVFLKLLKEFNIKLNSPDCVEPFVNQFLIHTLMDENNQNTCNDEKTIIKIVNSNIELGGFIPLILENVFCSEGMRKGLVLRNFLEGKISKKSVEEEFVEHYESDEITLFDLLGELDKDVV